MTEPLLEVKNLRKMFGAVEATKNLSFSVQKNTIHALIGPNGAGKTTAVNQLTGDIFPDSGSILYNGRDITKLKVHQRAKLGIARSFQITHIFENLTVAENLALAISTHSGHNFRFWKKALDSTPVKKGLAEALQRVDLTDRAELLASHLSHGEKRQLEVGMTLTRRPGILILDEPMAGMGPGGTVELAKLIKSLKSETTIILVEHDMDVVFSLADQITVLVYGENIASGTPDEIKNNSLVRSVYLGD